MDARRGAACDQRSAADLEPAHRPVASARGPEHRRRHRRVCAPGDDGLWDARDGEWTAVDDYLDDRARPDAHDVAIRNRREWGHRPNRLAALGADLDSTHCDLA